MFAAYKAQDNVDTGLEEKVAVFERVAAALDRFLHALESSFTQTGATYYDGHFLHNRSI